MLAGLTYCRISIIIPTWNEEKNIARVISGIQSSANLEIILVDGGSQDNTVNLAKALNVTVISSPPGRAVQMNIGAAVASGDILLFLHADTKLPPDFETFIRAALQQPGVVAGAFTLAIDAPQWGLRLVEWGVKWRSLLWQLPYGDQGIFLTKSMFMEIGKFPELPIMEDFELMQRLKKRGKITIVPVPVMTSARRWLKKGIFRTTLINQIVIIGYLLGIAPERIRAWYRQ
ncbi:glycosyl transferase, family 2 [Richelia sinica FACHB-800]|uniref:4,4'-diaponeurosporenoate glycosyltransferase n=1 Tax=Richelia sinica FACHB-800 TaxID=1357546 RepID=A0A975Y6J5_9NOST|nr:TIGR04283 family arsenosugar biosynthesis glycosyltransferase [Richelia sinica]MBD2664769.1 TIGR04283 family arsenosugar biosynthesis glycosyltransferase [Richelia sinica FACHB-800]QXE25319.1 glycosyl transferase, family 2 [Richelia sinica FACHB-800]